MVNSSVFSFCVYIRLKKLKTTYFKLCLVKPLKENKKTKLKDLFPSVQTDWSRVRGLFKDENFYKKQLITDIVEEINKINQLNENEDSDIKVKVELCDSPEEPHWEYSSVIKFIKSSFLKKLEIQEIIRNLKINNEPLAIDGEYFAHDYVVAEMTINNPVEFKSRASSFFIKATEKINEAEIKKILDKFKIDKGCMQWKGKRIPFERGEGSMMILFLKNAELRKDGVVLKEGRLLRKRDFQKVTGKKKKNYFVEARKNIYEKIREYELPIHVEHPSTNSFLMVIDY